MKNKRCGNCGSFEVKKKPYSGPYPWKDFPQVVFGEADFCFSVRNLRRNHERAW